MGLDFETELDTSLLPDISGCDHEFAQFEVVDDAEHLVCEECRALLDPSEYADAPAEDGEAPSDRRLPAVEERSHSRFDRPLHRDWIAWLTGFTLSGAVMNTMRMYDGVDLEGNAATAFAIDLSFALAITWLVFGLLPTWIRTRIRSGGGESRSLAGVRYDQDTFAGEAGTRPVASSLEDHFGEQQCLGDLGVDPDDEIAELEAEVDRLKKARRVAELKAEIGELRATEEREQSRSR